MSISGAYLTTLKLNKEHTHIPEIGWHRRFHQMENKCVISNMRREGKTKHGLSLKRRKSITPYFAGCFTNYVYSMAFPKMKEIIAEIEKRTSHAMIKRNGVFCIVDVV